MATGNCNVLGFHAQRFCLRVCRLFVVGFPQEMLEEGGRLYNCLSAARKLVDGVYSSPQAIHALLQDLHLQGAPSRPGSPVFFTAQGSAPADAAADDDDGAAAAAVAAEGATRRRSAPLDFTEGPQDSCYRVLLVPEHFDSQALQQLLGQVPLWRLLACPVAVFRQGPNRGLLQELQRLQKQHAATAAAGSRAAAGTDAGNSSISSSLKVPPGIALTTQLYRDELAVSCHRCVLLNVHRSRLRMQACCTIVSAGEGTKSAQPGACAGTKC